MDWLRWLRRRPIGETAQDYRVTTQMAQYHNSQLSKKDRHKTRKPNDFAWWRGKIAKAKPVQSAHAIKDKVAMIFGLGRSKNG